MNAEGKAKAQSLSRMALVFLLLAGTVVAPSPAAGQDRFQCQCTYQCKQIFYADADCSKKDGSSASYPKGPLLLGGQCDPTDKNACKKDCQGNREQFCTTGCLKEEGRFFQLEGGKLIGWDCVAT